MNGKIHYQGIGGIPFLKRFIPKSSGRVLQISLATFDENNIGEDSKREELQRGILKQLFYKVNSSKIPLSRYRKLHHIMIICDPLLIFTRDFVII